MWHSGLTTISRSIIGEMEHEGEEPCMSLEKQKDEADASRECVSQLGDLLGYHLRRASLVDLLGATAALDTVNTRPVPMSVLLSIIEKPGISSAEICRTLGMQRANIVPILAELEQRGFFLRESDRSDQRIQRLFATVRGSEEGARWLALAAEHENKVFGRLTVEERADLRLMLAKIWQENGPGQG